MYLDYVDGVVVIVTSDGLRPFEAPRLYAKITVKKCHLVNLFTSGRLKRRVTTNSSRFDSTAVSPQGVKDDYTVPFGEKKTI
ncbi:hypothetical protein TNCV_827731 [Trichonephila clavipes]|nr:hypothetical protein TNCV_827731 [Trichonephila clavipes]